MRRNSRDMSRATGAVVGLDVGIHATKATLLHDGGQAVVNVAMPAGLDSAESVARRAVQQALQKGGVSENPDRTIATGQGKSLINFADETISEAVCLARGIHEVLPSVRTLMDLGVQKTLVVKCADGYPVKMAVSDKCASGSGSYLEVVAEVLEMDFHEMGQASLQSTEQIEIDSICAVFAESEIISLLHSKKKVEDIMKAIYKSLAKRLHSLLLRVGVERDLALVGGMAADIGLRVAIEEEVGETLLVPEERLFIGSLGAARIAEE